MLAQVVLTQRKPFIHRQIQALSAESPVPSHVRQHLGSLIQKARVYQPNVVFVDGTIKMEGTAGSFTDGSIFRRIYLGTETQKTPSCCPCTEDKGGYPCLHGIEVLTEKYGSQQLHCFIDPCHLRTNWKKQYANICFSLPNQSCIDDIMRSARKAVLENGNSMEIL